MADLIQFKKGNKANLPNLRLGEPGVALDEGRLYIGGIDGNIKIPNYAELQNVNAQLADNTNKIGILSTEIDSLSEEVNAARTEQIGSSRLKDNDIPASKLKISTDADKIKLVNLSDEVLQAMAGTTPVNATPGVNSVTTEKIAPKAVTKDKIEDAVTAEIDKISNLEDSLNIVTSTGFIENDMVYSGEPGYYNSTDNNFTGWGAILNVTIPDINKIIIQKGSNFVVTQPVTITLWESTSPTTISGATLVQQFTMTAVEWNALPLNQDIVFTLTTPKTVQADKFYAVTVYSPGKVGVMQTGMNPSTGYFIGKVTANYKCGIYSTATGAEAATNYKSTSDGQYGLYVWLQGTNYSKKLQLLGEQVPEHQSLIEALQSDIDIITANGFIDPVSVRAGNPVYIYNANGLLGWATVLQTNIDQISSFVIQKDTTYNPNYGTSTTPIKVALYEHNTTSSFSTSEATLIQQWDVPLSDWIELTNGEEMAFTLTTPYIPKVGKYYVITVFHPFGVGIKQVYKSGAGVPAAVKNGFYCNDVNGINYTPTSNNSALYVKIYKETNPTKRIIVQGRQVIEHDQAIKDLQTRMSNQEMTELPNIKSRLDKIEQAGFINIGVNDPGTPRYINHALFKGFGTILKNLDIADISAVAIKKAVSVSVTPTTNTVVRLFETSSATSIAGATLIKEWTITPAQWNAITTTDDYVLNLDAPYTVKPGKYYAVTIWNANGINAMQVGYNPNTEQPSAGSQSAYYSYGLYTTTSNNSTYTPSTNGKYGTYFALRASNYKNVVKIYPEQVPDHDASIKALQTDVSKLKNGKYTFVHEIHYENPLVKKAPTFLDHWLRRDKDMYVLLSGDSIFAWMTATRKAKAGVAAVPPTCDKRAFAGLLWELIQFGNPVYRRFDYGKNALVGSWDTTWANADAPFFIENGAFDTFYYSGTNGQNAYDSNLTNIAITTKITKRDCPITKFCQADNQRHIPKRISNTANASVTFTIPAGYKKFDFIYETNQQADDNVTVTIAEGSGKVKVNTVDRDFSGNIEANGFVFSQRELKDESQDGYDSGIQGKRLFFEKNNRDEAITVTITKSADTTKYLFYWGVCYWGTATEPNACHLINLARGSSRMSSIYNNRFYRYTSVVPKPDLIIQECTLINNSTDSTDPAVYLAQHNQLVDYLNTLGVEYFFVIPHAHKDRLVEPYIRLWDSAKAEIIKNGHSYVDVQKLFYKIWQREYPNAEVSWQSFFASLMYDGVCHPNDVGFDLYKILLEPIFDLI